MKYIIVLFVFVGCSNSLPTISIEDLRKYDLPEEPISVGDTIIINDGSVGFYHGWPNQVGQLYIIK
jgi:hypothetical protein